MSQDQHRTEKIRQIVQETIGVDLGLFYIKKVLNAVEKLESEEKEAAIMKETVLFPLKNHEVTFGAARENSLKIEIECIVGADIDLPMLDKLCRFVDNNKLSLYQLKITEVTNAIEVILNTQLREDETVSIYNKVSMYLNKQRTIKNFGDKAMAVEATEPKDGEYGSYNIEGLGPDAKTVTNKEGGRQSHSPYAFECLPPLALARIARVLSGGKEKYGRNNWVKIDDPLDHVGKAIGHTMAYLAGDTQEGTPDEHLAHSLCRLLFALDLIERKKQK